jgi:hypothetical protein
MDTVKAMWTLSPAAGYPFLIACEVVAPFPSNASANAKSSAPSWTADYSVLTVGGKLQSLLAFRSTLQLLFALVWLAARYPP